MKKLQEELEAYMRQVSDLNASLSKQAQELRIAHKEKSELVSSFNSVRAEADRLQAEQKVLDPCSLLSGL